MQSHVLLAVLCLIGGIASLLMTYSAAYHSARGSKFVSGMPLMGGLALIVALTAIRLEFSIYYLAILVIDPIGPYAVYHVAKVRPKN
ncbi:MAG: hypothetical protein ACK5Z4_01545 [Planctomyces sp.]|jgi:hypothetical protein